jgi:hypothetical protein
MQGSEERATDYLPQAKAGVPPATRHLVRDLASRGVPVFVAPPSRSTGHPEFRFPRWALRAADPAPLDNWRPGYAIAARTGIAFDVIDIDPRNGGDTTLRDLLDHLPSVGGCVSTPGGGLHLWVPPYGGRSLSVGGIDYQARNRLIYLPGTRRPKHGGRGYRWLRLPDWAVLCQHNAGDFVERMSELRATKPRRPQAVPVCTEPEGQQRRAIRGSAYGRAALQDEADDLARTAAGGRNDRLNQAAFRCGQLVAAGHLTESYAMELLLHAAIACGLAAEDGETASVATIRSGLRAGRLTPRATGGQAHG